MGHVRGHCWDLARSLTLTYLSFVHRTLLLISFISARPPHYGQGYPREDDDIDDDTRDDRNIKCHQTVFSPEETSVDLKVVLISKRVGRGVGYQ